MMINKLAIFEEDIVQGLLQQPDFQSARKYWDKLKERLKNEGSQTVTNCNRLKMKAVDGKNILPMLLMPEPSCG